MKRHYCESAASCRDAPFRGVSRHLAPRHVGYIKIFPSRKGWKSCVALFFTRGLRAATCGTRRATTCHEAFVPRRAATCHDVPRRATTCDTSRRPFGEVSLLALREAAIHARASPKSTSPLNSERACHRKICFADFAKK